MIRRLLPAAIVALGPVVSPAARAAQPTKQECVTANESAQDLRHAGQLRAARKQLAMCVSTTCPAPVREDCAALLAQVDAAMPSLVLVAKDRAGNDLSAVLVTMDGLPFADNLDGTAIQVDPGEHRFVFEGEGLPPMEKVVVAHEGDRSRHVNVVLGVATGSPGDDRKEPLFSPNHRRIAGIGLAAAGGLGLIVGSIFGLVAKSTYDRAWIECGSDPRGCTPQGVQDGATAHSQATVATASFVTGVLLAGGGAALYFTAPKASAVAVGPTFGVDGPQLRIRAVW